MGPVVNVRRGRGQKSVVACFRYLVDVVDCVVVVLQEGVAVAKLQALFGLKVVVVVDNKGWVADELNHTYVFLDAAPTMPLMITFPPSHTVPWMRKISFHLSSTTSTHSGTDRSVTYVSDVRFSSRYDYTVSFPLTSSSQAYVFE